MEASHLEVSRLPVARDEKHGKHCADLFFGRFFIYKGRRIGLLLLFCQMIVNSMLLDLWDLEISWVYPSLGSSMGFQLLLWQCRSTFCVVFLFFFRGNR